MGILRGLGLLVAASPLSRLWCVSAAANYAHALHLAAGSDYADIMALASVGADVVKFIAVDRAVHRPQEALRRRWLSRRQ